MLNERVRRTGRGMVALLAGALVGAFAPPATAHHDEVVDKLERGRTTLVSVSSSGERGNEHSGSGCDQFPYSASDDGRFIAFSSLAGNLHPADTNGRLLRDVFVHDRKTGELELASALPNGLGPSVPPLPDVLNDDLTCAARSSAPAISGNGRFVAFVSNLPLTGIEGLPQEGVPLFKIYRRDLKKNITELVSVTPGGEPANNASGVGVTRGGESTGLSISDNGRFVAFTSLASNLVDDPCAPEDASISPVGEALPCLQSYVRDMDKDKTMLVSRSSAGEPANYPSLYPSISGSGRYVVFESQANNLIDIDLNQCLHRVPASVEPPPSCSDVFIHDLRSGDTELVSVSRDGGPGSDSSVIGSWGAGHQTVSEDGRFVTFHSYAPEMVPQNHHVPGSSGTYVRDRKTGRTERLSVSSTGAMLQSNVLQTISDDGRYALFNAHLMSDLYVGGAEAPLGGPYTPRDQGHEDRGTFLYDRATGQLDWALFDIGNGSDEGAPPGTDMNYGALGGNARFLVGASEQIDGPSSKRESHDVYVRDLGNYPLGTGPYGGSKKNDEPPEQQEICVTPETCVPPQQAVSWRAGDRHRVAQAGAKLYGASLAYRPALDDLYAAIELEHMGPSLSVGPAGLVTGGLPWLVYGLRFEVAGRSYEVRATSLLGGTFGLFDCTEDCAEVATLEGGYGTTGERVVVSIPLDEIGLRSGGRLRKVEVFSALGTYDSGAQTIFDRLRLK